MKKQKELEIRYCSYCGNKMKVWLKRADECLIKYPYDTIGISFATRYDRKTGKENYLQSFQCPDYENKKWYQLNNPHDMYYIEEIFNL